MHGDTRHPGAIGHSQRRGLEPRSVPPYLVYAGIPPMIAAFVLAAIDPFGGVALLACWTIMVIVLNVVLRRVR
jgi:hypothetical protein